MPRSKKTVRDSNLELLRILCILVIIADHFTGQSGLAMTGCNVMPQFFYCGIISLSRVACSVFIIISAWFCVDRPFKFKRIAHTWITALTYCLILTVVCIALGKATRTDLFTALLPVAQSPVWFVGYYAVLMAISPLLNLLINKGSRHQLLGVLTAFGVFMVACSTATDTTGMLASEMWPLIFVYLMTGYLKKYKPRPKASTSFLVFGVIWLLLTLARTIANSNLGQGTFMQQVAVYGEAYRAYLQTLPNLVLAFSLFYGFLGLRIKPSQSINLVASATLGVYCFHQAPIWREYLITTLSGASALSPVLHGAGRMGYILLMIFLIWLVGTALELARLKASALLIENRRPYLALCAAIDSLVNGPSAQEHPQQAPADGDDSAAGQQEQITPQERALVATLLGAAFLYYVIVKAIAFL